MISGGRYTYEDDDDRFEHSSNVKIITSNIWETAVWVIVAGGIYEVCLLGGFFWHDVQGDSNMTGTDLYVNKPQSVPVIFEPPCTYRVSWRLV
jgi:hypothetical protein